VTPETATVPADRARVGFAVVFPLILLAIVVMAIVKFGPGEMLRDPDAPPVEALSVQRTLLKPEGILLTVLNESPEPVTIAQVIVDDAYWKFSADGPLTVGRLRSVTLTIPYPWVTGEAHHIAILTTTGTKFEHEIAVALRSPEPDSRHLLLFAAIGVFVGVIPVALGLLWFPIIRRMGRTGLDVVLAFTVGLLVFLLIDAANEGLESSHLLPEAYQGVALFLAAVAGAYVALEMLGAWLRRRRADIRASAAPSGWILSLLIAIGIGLHNFGEGLAIGAAFSLGEVAFGTLLIIGFTLHNATEGLAIIAPMAKEQPSVWTLVKLGLIGGVPTIFGAWLGGLVYSRTWTVLFLGLGVGAILQVILQILGQMSRERPLSERLVHTPVVLGLLAGFAVMYVTGILVG
jgi:zinc transporter, ZIP family